MGVRHPFARAPEAGETLEVAPGIHWLRMPLPFQLDHINLWLLEDGEGWTVVDTGINRPEVRATWERLFAGPMAGRPLRRMVVTHFHPDHMGLAGWLGERFPAPLWATLGEWAFARMLKLDTGPENRADFIRFYRAAGFDDALMALVEERRVSYPERIAPVPFALRRIREGETFDIGGRSWRVITGLGHSPEHASLYSPELKVLIAGDQVLPVISPNISVWPHEPEAEPLTLYLESLPAFRPLPAETLVLPSHHRPFTGLHARLDELAHHHDRRIEETWAACERPSTATEVLRSLFRRELDSHQVFFAIGESLAHLHYLERQGRISQISAADGVRRFQRRQYG